ncbi:MAG: hypothetical protein Q8N53_05500, partial [Longimicrobiales bacterium]|nr:hypothetical protein [Longimicrobiales bacterium]
MAGFTGQPVASVDPANRDFSDLQDLRDVIGDSRVVMLGEQSHGDGTVFLAKTRLIEFLHQEMGFDVLAFESGLFDMRKAWEAMAEGRDPREAFSTGVGLAWGAIRVVEAMVPRTVPLMNRIEMNGWAVLFALGAALISVVLSGLLPAYYGSRLDLAGELNRESRGSTARGRRRLMDFLVVGELALSMVLLSGAAVMVRTLVAMNRRDLGFEPDGVVTFDVNAWGPEYRNAGARGVLYRRLEEELAAIPGVERVARTS